jgi:hypothetical protein
MVPSFDLPGAAADYTITSWGRSPAASSELKSTLFRLATVLFKTKLTTLRPAAFSA